MWLGVSWKDIREPARKEVTAVMFAQLSACRTACLTGGKSTGEEEQGKTLLRVT